MATERPHITNLNTEQTDSCLELKRLAEKKKKKKKKKKKEKKKHNKTKKK